MFAKAILSALSATTLLAANTIALEIRCADPPGNPSTLADCNCALNELGSNPSPDPVGVQAGQCWAEPCGNCYLSISPYKGYENLATIPFLKSASQAIINQCISPNGEGTGLQVSDGEVPVVAVSPSQCPEVVDGLSPVPTVQPIQSLPPSA